MFLRYFLLVSDKNLSEPSVQSPGFPDSSVRLPNAEPNEDHDLVVWDIALACLALSVKVSEQDDFANLTNLILLQFHRDFLDPLYPVQADEFLALAHHDVNYEEFEVIGSQLNLLHTLHFLTQNFHCLLDWSEGCPFGIHVLCWRQSSTCT